MLLIVSAGLSVLVLAPGKKQDYLLVLHVRLEIDAASQVIYKPQRLDCLARVAGLSR